LTPTASRRVIGSINVYKDNSLVGNVINGGNVACLYCDTDNTIAGNVLLNIIDPKISRIHNFNFLAPSESLKNCNDHIGNVITKNKWNT